MAIIYEEIIPSPIENVTIKKGIVDGVHRNYNIEPNEGYILHDKGYDYTVTDEITGEETLILGYRRTMASCSKTQLVFDENNNVVINTREFYAVPENSVPADQIFGTTNPDHEVM